ncbi:Protein of unknown function D [Prunus dulcis]|uniref:Uncharacterized protein n=1 Tax=Prunus dulcis TaxID=3755 RepID=A0A4Y1RH95_PRUDU|nr:Protein of unknown function D [Prunus dulcis]
MSATGSHTNKTSQKKDRPQIIKLNKALELAKKWVNDMTEPAEDEHFEIQSRPARQRKLHYKLDAGRRAAAKIAEESAAASAASDDDDDEDLDSRTKAFEKKRPAAPVTPSLGGKKRKKLTKLQSQFILDPGYSRIAKEDLLLIGEMLLLNLWMHIYDLLSNCLNQKMKESKPSGFISSTMVGLVSSTSSSSTRLSEIIGIELGGCISESGLLSETDGRLSKLGAT